MAAIAIHGGAGALPRSDVTADAEAAYRDALGEALDAGFGILDRGGSALDAVEAAVTVLEDSPLFNAGRGAVFTHDGRIELDAAIMDGTSEDAGAVAGVRGIRNPIQLARRVMADSPHVFLVGSGAEAFAATLGIGTVPEEYFHTERRRAQLEAARAVEGGPLPSIGYFGTVGAVAVDAGGRLAAATSTGGMTNKRFGRIGDSPVIGAGTYASDGGCAVSATGHGEYFIRAVVGHEISALVRHAGLPLAEAVRRVIQDKLPGMGGAGGAIAIDAAGNVALEFNTEAMFRGSRVTGGENEIAIHR